jgi:hypothetical protein
MDADIARQLKSIAERHLDIADDDIRVMGFDLFQGLQTVFRFSGNLDMQMSETGQERPDIKPVSEEIIHYKDFDHWRLSLPIEWHPTDQVNYSIILDDGSLGVAVINQSGYTRGAVFALRVKTAPAHPGLNGCDEI